MHKHVSGVTDGGMLTVYLSNPASPYAGKSMQRKAQNMVVKAVDILLLIDHHEQTGFATAILTYVYVMESGHQYQQRLAVEV